MTDMTPERARELLEGTSPGPWSADGNPQNRIVWSPDGNRVCFMAHSNGLNDDRDIAVSNLVAAAPDLARAYLAEHAARVEAEAAQALVIERAAEAAGRAAVEALLRRKPNANGLEIRMARQNVRLPVLSFASDTGIKALARLRAERDELAERVSDLEASFQDALTGPQIDRLLFKQTEAERDRLAARVAELEAREKAVDAGQTFYIDCEFDGHGGSLLSIAMVRGDGLGMHVKTGVVAEDPWVIANVVPLLDAHNAQHAFRVRPRSVGVLLRNFIGDCQRPTIIADSPVDIGRFCEAISTGSDGGWASTGYQGMTFKVFNIDCYPTTLKGAIQHNAWWDAMALRAALSEATEGGAG